MPIITKKIHTNQEIDDMLVIYSDLKSNVSIRELLENQFLNKCGYGMLMLELVSFNRNPLVNNRERPNGKFRFGAELELRGMTYEKGEIITDCTIVHIVESSTLGTTQYFGKSKHAMILLNYQPEIQHYKIGDVVPVVVYDAQFDLHKPEISISAKPLTYESILDIDAEESESDQIYYFNDFAEWSDIQKLEDMFNEKVTILEELSKNSKPKLAKFIDLVNPYKKTSVTKLEKGFPGYKKVSLTELRESSKDGLTGEIIHPYFSHRHEPFVYYKDKTTEESHKPVFAIQGIWNQKIRGLDLLIDLIQNYDPTHKDFISAWSVFEKSKK
jgi:hypothetical protein